MLRLLFVLFCLFVIRLAAADAGGSPPAKADETFLRDYSETRGFMLGRPTNVKITPDGSAVLFLRSPPRSPANELFAFDVATATTKRLLTPAQLLGGGEEQLSA